MVSAFCMSSKNLTLLVVIIGILCSFWLFKIAHNSRNTFCVIISDRKFFYSVQLVRHIKLLIESMYNPILQIDHLSAFLFIEDGDRTGDSSDIAGNSWTVIGQFPNL